jgi:hypothetical protein
MVNATAQTTTEDPIDNVENAPGVRNKIAVEQDMEPLFEFIRNTFTLWSFYLRPMPSVSSNRCSITSHASMRFHSR